MLKYNVLPHLCGLLSQYGHEKNTVSHSATFLTYAAYPYGFLKIPLLCTNPKFTEAPLHQLYVHISDRIQIAERFMKGECSERNTLTW